MKILFYTVGVEQLGVEYLMSYLKEGGHEIDLIADTEIGLIPFGVPEKPVENRLEKRVEKFSPDIVAASVNISTYPRTKKFIRKHLSGRNVKVVLGGPHATSCPEFILRDIPEVDYVCIGEGEKPLLELANSMKRGETTNRIKGLAHLENGNFVNNGPADLVKEIDGLPHPRKKEFREEIGSSNDLRLITGRGCPYSCSYCINSYYKKLYSNNYVRKRSVEGVIEEIKYFRKRYSFNRVVFIDETFTYDKDWALDFLEKYSEEIHIPLHIYARPETLDEELCEALKRAGCNSMFMGVDSGSERIRKIHNRTMTDETIKKAARTVKKHGIELHVSAMFGNTDETKEESWSTLRLLENINPDKVHTFILLPLPKTRITKELKERGKISLSKIDEIKKSGRKLNTDSVYREQDFDYVFSRLVPLYIDFKFLRPLIRKLIEREDRTISKIMYKVDISKDYLKFLKSNLKNYFSSLESYFDDIFSFR